jgi:tetratricopeptide (TPR) repeat protein
VAVDPAEAKNEFDIRPLADKMAQSLRRLEGSSGANVTNRTVDVDPDVRARLAALGYIGTFVSQPTAPLPKAERELDAVLAKDPHMTAARASLGALRLQQGDAEAAEHELRAALARDPDLALAHFNLALLSEQRGDLGAAADEYRQEAAQHPGSYMAQFNLGKVYEKTGNRKGQLEAYQDAVASNPSFAEGQLFLAKLYLGLHQFDAAVRSARLGLKLQPEDPWAPLGHFVLGDVDATHGHIDEAAAEVARGRTLAARARK